MRLGSADGPVELAPEELFLQSGTVEISAQLFRIHIFLRGNLDVLGLPESIYINKM